MEFCEQEGLTSLEILGAFRFLFSPLSAETLALYFNN